MEKAAADSNNDLLTEKYQGPSAHIAALGTGVVKHLAWAGIGILGGGVVALAMPKKIAFVIEEGRKLGTACKAATPTASLLGHIVSEIKHAFGCVLHVMFGDPELSDSIRWAANQVYSKNRKWFDHAVMNKEQGFGNLFLTHLVGVVPHYGGKMKDALYEVSERAINDPLTPAAQKASNIYLSNALRFGGAVGLVGYIGGWLKALVSGAVNGNKGKRQHERLVEALQDQMDINEKLRTDYKNAVTRLEEIRSDSDKLTPAKLNEQIAPLAEMMEANAANAAVSQHASHAAEHTPHHAAHATAPINSVHGAEKEHRGRIESREQEVAPA